MIPLTFEEAKRAYIECAPNRIVAKARMAKDHPEWRAQLAEWNTAKLEDAGGVWKTVNGRHIFIKDGQSVEDALGSEVSKDEKIQELQSKLDDETTIENKYLAAEEWLSNNPEKRREFYSDLKKEASQKGYSLEAYQGTNSYFGEFDKSKGGSTTSGPGTEDAIWITEDKAYASERGTIVMPVFANPGKTMVVREKTDTFDAGKIVKKAKSDGYDSVRFDKLDDADSDSNGRTAWAMISAKVKSGREVEFNKMGQVISASERFN